MHVFITGGTGLIGSAVISELREHGHTVLGLARSDASAAALSAAGAETLRGSLADVDVLREGARRSDGVVQLAFDHAIAAPEDFERALAEETAAFTALGEELVGSDRALAVVSGTPWIAGRASTEEDPLPSEGPVAARARAVEAALGLAARGVRSASVRMPRTVHAEGRGGFAGILTETARQTGVVGYPGDGEQRWPAVHARDAAVLFRLVLEGAPAGTSWHAVADEGDRVRDICEVIGRRLGLPVESVPEEAFGPFGSIFALDQPATSTRTRELLGWEPTHPGLLEDLELLEP